jgi:hypothetical protein
MENKIENKITEMLEDNKMLIGLFLNNSQADKAFDILKSKGYTNEEINIVMSENTRTNYYPTKTEVTESVSSSMEGAKTGTAIGSTLGATIGSIIGVAVAISSNIIIPGIGLLIAGPILVGIAGASTGVVTGGIIGALLGVEADETKTQQYEKHLQEGQIIIGVHSKPQDIESIKLAWDEIKTTIKN